jgi:DeoR/GlpR family transcriptional regulator of sugar metabolism
MTPKQEKKAPLKGAARRQAIADMVEKTERVDVNELAELFSVTIETVRRDLINLEENGLLGRVHGGAVLRSPSLLRLQAPSAMERAKLRIRKKFPLVKQLWNTFQMVESFYWMPAQQFLSLQDG